MNAPHKRKGEIMGTTILIEAVELLENTLNEEARTVGVVLIRPGWSKNKRYYSRDVLSSAAQKYENAFAFADHQSVEDVRKGKSRSILATTGRYTDVRIGTEGELLATRHVYDNAAGNAVWPVIVDAVKNPGQVNAGLSHTAVGATRKGEADGVKGEIVEGITAVHSVDDVVSPAAGGEYTALVADTNTLRTAIMESLTRDEWQAARPEFVEALKKDNKRARQTEQERAARAELEEAQQQIAALEAKNAVLNTEVITATSDRDTARDKASRADQRVALEQAFRSANLEHKIETQLRKRIGKENDSSKWLGIVQEAKDMQTALGGNRTAVTGAPQRVHVTTMPEQTAPTPGISPDEMAEVKSAEDLALLLKRKGG